MPDDIAEKFIEAEAYDKAVERLKEVLEEGEDTGLRMRLASCQFRMGRSGEALANSRLAAESDSEHRLDALFLIGYILRSLKRYRESSRAYMEFAELDGKTERAEIARFSAALCLEELDDWMGAAEVFESIGTSEADFRRALCYERAGRSEEAAEMFESFLKQYDEGPELLKVRFRLGSLRMRQGRTNEAVSHLEEAKRLGEDTFIGKIAEELLEKAHSHAKDVQRKLQRYNY